MAAGSGGGLGNSVTLTDLGWESGGDQHVYTPKSAADLRALASFICGRLHVSGRAGHALARAVHNAMARTCGIYWVRLVRGELRRTRRVAVIEFSFDRNKWYPRPGELDPSGRRASGRAGEGAPTRNDPGRPLVLLLGLGAEVLHHGP